MASSQTLPQSSDIQTEGELWNNSKQTLCLEDKMIWKGSPSADSTETIEKDKTGELKHFAGSDDASYAALSYKIMDQSMWWVVAWENMKDEKNKVYTDITDEAVDWVKVKHMLDTEGSVAYDTVKHEYGAEIKIDAHGNLPQLRATFELEVVAEMAK